MRLRSLLTVLIVCLLCGVPGRGRAATSDPRVVTLILAGSDEDVSRLGSLLEATLSAEHVRVRTLRMEHIPPQRVSQATHHAANDAARLWLDCSELGRTRLYLTTPDASRIFVRDFSFDQGLDRTALELLAFVSRNSIRALLAGDEVGVAREEYERTIAERGDQTESVAAAVPSVAEATGARAGHAVQASEWHLAASYELEALRASAIEHGPGAALEWESPQLSLGIAAQLRLPTRVGDGSIRARLISRSARILIARPWRVSPSASFSLGAALGFDWIRVEPEAADGTASVNSSFSVADACARSYAGFRYRLGGLELGVLAGAELGFVPARYRVMLPSAAAEDVFTPWRLRPLGALSLGGHW